jgi:hypothetical protein
MFIFSPHVLLVQIQTSSLPVGSTAGGLDAAREAYSENPPFLPPGGGPRAIPYAICNYLSGQWIAFLQPVNRTPLAGANICLILFVQLLYNISVFAESYTSQVIPQYGSTAPSQGSKMHCL